MAERPKWALATAPTGIRGLDEVLNSGLPRGRPTLVCGSAGCGKTILAMEFLIHGVADHGDPGVFFAFEETEPELVTNFASLGLGLEGMVERKEILIDHVHLEREEILQAGEFDLEGLFIRVGAAVETVGAKRVVFDTLEALFAHLPDPATLRAELRRLFRWLKERELTAIITAERGTSELTRHGLEEYVSDCVLFLDHRVTEQISTRRMRVVKYRGSSHGANEYPFLIDDGGIWVFPSTSMTLEHPALEERVSSGVPSLDDKLAGGGWYRGSSVMISGTAGTGKSSLGALFVRAACERGERALYLAFEESPSQIVRNMRSIGVDLQGWIDRDLLRIEAQRPSSNGLEMHLCTILHAVKSFDPRVVVIDPISAFDAIGSDKDVAAMLMRLVDHLKMGEVTSMFLSLTRAGEALESTAGSISSLIDSWVLLRDLNSKAARPRLLTVLKSRGMDHSRRGHEYLITDSGIELVEGADER